MKTAVEWLVQQLRNGKEFNDELIQQAKEMERQQILEAHESASLDAGFEYSASDLANNYYKKKYT